METKQNMDGVRHIHKVRGKVNYGSLPRPSPKYDNYGSQIRMRRGAASFLIRF